jgi:hypothetical protein
MATTTDPTNPFKDQTDELTQQAQTTPDTENFDESQGVAGRVNSLTSAGGALFDSAAARAAADSAGRGLYNSTQGVQAGQQAVIETALPMAQADAGLYQQQKLANQAATNTSNEANANRTTNIGLTGINLGAAESQFGRSLAETAAARTQAGDIAKAQLAESGRQFDVGTGQQGAQFTQQLQETARQANQAADIQRSAQQTQITLASMDAASRQALADTEAQWRTSIASNQNLAQAWGTMQDEIAKIQNNPDLDPGTKSTLIQNNINAFGQFAQFWQKASGGTIDVGDLLNFQQTQGNYPVPPQTHDVQLPASNDILAGGGGGGGDGF